MNILVAHNFYKLAGGEDQCVAAEVALLGAHGHEVTQYCLSNDTIDDMGRLQLAGRTIWSRQTIVELRRLIRLHRRLQSTRRCAHRRCRPSRHAEER